MNPSAFFHDDTEIVCEDELDAACDMDSVSPLVADELRRTVQSSIPSASVAAAKQPNERRRRNADARTTARNSAPLTTANSSANGVVDAKELDSTSNDEHDGDDGDDDKDGYALAERERSVIERKARRAVTNLARQAGDLQRNHAATAAEFEAARERGRAEQRQREQHVVDEQREHADLVARAERHAAELTGPLRTGTASAVMQLRAAQSDEARAHTRDLLRQEIVLMPNNTAGDIARFFAEARAQGAAASASSVSATARHLGSGAVQGASLAGGPNSNNDDQRTRSLRIEAEHAQTTAFLSIMQLKAHSFYETLDAARRLGRTGNNASANAAATATAPVFDVSTITVSQFEAQLIPPIGMLPRCAAQDSCVACIDLFRHDVIVDGAQQDRALVPAAPSSSPAAQPQLPCLPLKAWQDPADFELFMRDGIVIDPERLRRQYCGACLVYMVTAKCRERIARCQPCAKSEMTFPFLFAVNRPDGLAHTAIIDHHTMPGAWLNYCTTAFVPVRRRITWSVLDAATHHPVAQSQDNVPVYELAAPVKYRPVAAACIPRASSLSISSSATASLSLSLSQSQQAAGRGIVTAPVNPVHRRRTAPASVPDVFAVLASEIRAHVPTAAVLNGVDVTSATRLRMAIEFLCVDLAESLAQVTASSANGIDLVRTFAPYVDRTLALLGSPSTGIASGVAVPATHLVALVVLWRVGFADTLQRVHAMRGNRNVDIYYNSHTSLLRFVHARWTALSKLPSDEQLVDSAVRPPLTPQVLLSFLHMQGALASQTAGPLRLPYITAVDDESPRRPSLVYHDERAVPMDTVRDHYGCYGARPLLHWFLREPDSPSPFGRATTAETISHATTRIFSSDACRFPLRNARMLIAAALQRDHADTAWLLEQLCVITWPTLATDLIAVFSATASASTWWPRAPLREPPGPVDAHVPLLVRRMGTASSARHQHFAALAVALRIHVLEALRDIHERSQSDAAVGQPSPSSSPDSTGSFGSIASPSAVLAAHQFFRQARRASTSSSVPCPSSATAASSRKQPRTARTGKVANAPRKTRRSKAKKNDDDEQDYDAILEEAYGGDDNSDDDDDDDEYGERQRDANVDVDASESPDVLARAIDALSRGDAAAIVRVAGELDASDHAGALVRDRVDAAFDGGIDQDGDKEAAVRTPMANARPRHCELTYALRCALFEHVEMACEIDDTHAVPGAHRRQHAGVVACEDLLADLSPYMGVGGLLRDVDMALDTPFVASSWLANTTAAMQMCCFIRDFESKHHMACDSEQYVRWTAQTMLVSLFGTYRHSSGISDSHTRFADAQRFARHLALWTPIDKLRQRVRDAPHIALCAQREALMFALENAPALRSVLRRVWYVNFDAVSRQWVPAVSASMRRIARMLPLSSSAWWQTLDKEVATLLKQPPASSSASNAAAPDDSGAAARNAVAAAAAAAALPRVFRRAKPSFATLMLAHLATSEITRWTDIIINARGPRHSLPPAVADAPDALMIYAADLVNASRMPMHVRTLADLGVSAEGRLLVFAANRVYVGRMRETAIATCVQQMSHTDRQLVWLAMHVLRAHAAVTPALLPAELGQRQTVAVRRRAALDGAVPVSGAKTQQQPLEPLPITFTHAFFCHLLGCNRLRNFYVPAYEHTDHFNMLGGSFVAENGAVACTRRSEKDMFSPVARRTRDSDIASAVAAYNAALSAAAADAALHAPDDATSLRRARDLERCQRALIVAQRKNVRAVVALAWHMCCSAAPMRSYCVLGQAVHTTMPPYVTTAASSSAASKDARAAASAAAAPPPSASSFTVCPRCGALALYSMDCYAANGCGQCDEDERLERMVARCISCDRGALPPELSAPPTAGPKTSSTCKTPAAKTTRASTPAKRRRAGSMASAAPAIPEPPVPTVNGQLRAYDTDIIAAAFNAPTRKPRRATVSGGGNNNKSAATVGIDLCRSRAPPSSSVTPASASASCLAVVRPLPLIPPRESSTLDTVVYYDDRPLVGSHKLTQFHLCSACRDRLPRNYPIVSLSEMLQCIDASPSKIRIDGVLVTVPHA